VTRQPRRVELLGRDKALVEINGLVRAGHHVLLWGPRGVGKSALIGALAPHSATVIDPFDGIHTRYAGGILRSMDRGAQFIAAARTLDRARLGAVRRFAWRFTTYSVPPLSVLWMRRVVERECARVGIDPTSDAWTRAAAHLARGCPGAAVALVQAAADRWQQVGVVPSPTAAYLSALDRQAGFADATSERMG
jgi:energy-coupling factor transporter ATP-binding protein EcfA2